MAEDAGISHVLRWVTAGLVVGLGVPSLVHATYSVVATDSSVTLVGGAGTSCVGALDVAIILGTAPGKGAVHAQAQISTQGRDQAVSLLMQGETPADIITAITDPDFQASSRQYGVVDLLGQAAGFTGSTNGVYAEDRQGTDGPYTYSVQGNILTSNAVINNAEDGFVNGGGCDLPDRLMLALEAGALDGEGDSRCTDEGIPADSAFIRVVDEAGTPIIDLSVTDTAPDSPLVSLRAEYDAWRVQNPCMVGGTGTGGGSTGGGDTGGASTTGTGGASSGGTAGSSDSDATGASASGGSATDTTAATGGVTAGSASATDSGGGGQDDGKGCACTHGTPSAPAWAWVALLAVPRRRRSGARPKE